MWSGRGSCSGGGLPVRAPRRHPGRSRAPATRWSRLDPRVLRELVGRLGLEGRLGLRSRLGLRGRCGVGSGVPGGKGFVDARRRCGGGLRNHVGRRDGLGSSRGRSRGGLLRGSGGRASPHRLRSRRAGRARPGLRACPARQELRAGDLEPPSRGLPRPVLGPGVGEHGAPDPARLLVDDDLCPAPSGPACDDDLLRTPEVDQPRLGGGPAPNRERHCDGPLDRRGLVLDRPPGLDTAVRGDPRVRPRRLAGSSGCHGLVVGPDERRSRRRQHEGGGRCDAEPEEAWTDEVRSAEHVLVLRSRHRKPPITGLGDPRRGQSPTCRHGQTLT